MWGHIRSIAGALSFGLVALLASALPLRAQTCAGDCNTDTLVTVDEILVTVNIALGSLPPANCPAGDTSSDGAITVDEILAAVARGLNGCGTSPTPTPTPRTSENLPAFEAFISSATDAIIEISGFANLEGSGSGAGSPTPPTTLPCSGGGTQTVFCAPGGGGNMTEISFDNCLHTEDGASTLIDGDFVQVSPSPCFSSVRPIGVPVEMTFTGSLAVDDPAGGTTFDGDVDMDVSVVVEHGGTVQISMNGSIDSDCVGSVDVETDHVLRIVPGAPCPNIGRLLVEIDGERSMISHGTGVSIDLGNDGFVDKRYDSCLDPDLDTCE